MTSRASCHRSSKATHGRRATAALGLRGATRLAAQKLAREPRADASGDGARPRSLPPATRWWAAQHWNSRGHFFAAAAEAMRRILVERARHKGRIQHGGGLRRVDLLDADAVAPTEDEQVLLLDEALTRLAAARPQAAELVKLRFFAGLTLEEIAPYSPSRRAPPGGSGSSPVPGCDGTWSAPMSPRPELRGSGRFFSRILAAFSAAASH